jgi:hypothetical protein
MITRKAVWGVLALAVAVPIAAVAQVGSPFGTSIGGPKLWSGKPEDARFRLVSEDGVAAPDGKSFVPAMKVWTIHDRTTGVCTALVFTPSGIATSAIMTCPTETGAR